MRLSVIIPVYNGAATIERLVRELLAVVGSVYDLEVVLVNDGSADNSAEICRRLAQEDARVVFVDLSRNFGEHNADMAGLNYCTGDAAVFVDDDFQNPPSEILRLVRKLEEGYDVVFASYEEKKHAWWRNLGSRFNNLVATWMLGKPRDLYLCSFKAINRFVIDHLIAYRGPFPYLDGIIWQITRRYAVVPVEHAERQVGRSGYTLRKLVALWMNMFTNFSVLPLRLATLLGFLLSGLSFVLGLVYFLERLVKPNLPQGWPTIAILLCLFAGVQLLAIGMVGEYVGRLFLKTAGRPQFIVRETVRAGRPGPANVPRPAEGGPLV